MKFTLQELLEQKALLEKHLELIDSRIVEIQGETGRPQPAPTLPESISDKGSSPAPSPIVQQPQATLPVDAETDQPTPVVPEIEVQSFAGQATVGDTKKGCLLWTALIVGLGILAFILFYLYYPSWDEEKAREKWKDLPKEEERAGR